MRAWWSGCGHSRWMSRSLPINGRAPERRVAGNLSGAEAARLAKSIGARLVIPCHYEMFEFNTADRQRNSSGRPSRSGKRIMCCGAESGGRAQGSRKVRKHTSGLLCPVRITVN